MGLVLSAIGIILLLAALAGVAFGVYMAADPKTREPGKLFAVWWVPVAAAASGVLMRDIVTFAVGTLCFLVAGAVFTLEGGKKVRPRPAPRRTNWKLEEDSEKTTAENRAAEDEAAS